MRWIFPARLPSGKDFQAPIHDGDTLWLELDKGHRQSALLNIRLSDVRAPELGEPGGLDASRWLLDWLTVRDLGQPWPYYVETFKTRTGADRKTLDRYLGMVYDYDPRIPITSMRLFTGSCLNVDLIEWLRTHPEWGPGKVLGDV